jgi:hypothetical protein
MMSRNQSKQVLTLLGQKFKASHSQEKAPQPPGSMLG